MGRRADGRHSVSEDRRMTGLLKRIEAQQRIIDGLREELRQAKEAQQPKETE